MRYWLAQTSLGFVQLADVLENFAAGRRRFVSRRFVLGMTDEATQMLTVGFGIISDEGFEGLVVARDQAVAPAFQSVEAFVLG